MAVVLGGEDRVDPAAGLPEADLAPDRPEVGVFARLLGQVLRHVDHVLVREHLAHPAEAKLARDGVGRPRADEDRHALAPAPREVYEVLVAAVRGEELPEDEAAGRFRLHVTSPERARPRKRL